ncbi:mitochondrial import receptor subunit TOM7 homolog [Perognathus longimembris pacificus]|nr:mitochondrial import receptor subunit TOM7 homolog [Perognathus longimembris pacificus]
MVKLSKEAKSRLQQLCTPWDFIPLFIYLGFERDADGIPEPDLLSLHWK